MTNQELLDSLILQRKHLNDTMLKLGELALDFIELLDWVDEELLPWTKGVVNDLECVFNDFYEGKKPATFTGLDKRLKAMAEELDGFRIYTLSTLKEIKKQPIKKHEITEAEL